MPYVKQKSCPLVKQSRCQMALTHAARGQAVVERALLSYIIVDYLNFF